MLEYIVIETESAAYLHYVWGSVDFGYSCLDQAQVSSISSRDILNDRINSTALNQSIC